MSLLAAALLCFAGFSAICLSMRKHFRAVLVIERDPPRLLLAMLASFCILGASVLLAFDYGWPIAVAVTLGLLSVAAGAVVLSVTLAPSALLIHACAASVLATVLALGNW